MEKLVNLLDYSISKKKGASAFWVVYNQSQAIMGRHTITQGPIEIAYGSDHLTGYFFSVFDERLQWAENATEAVNAVAEGVNPDGGGCYFDLHSGPMGFGRKVDVATLTTFWARYGVPEAHIQNAKQGIFF